MRRLLFTLILLCIWSSLAAADSINFENLVAGTVVTNQYAALGVTFSGGTILTAGINLNEFNFPPHSGLNVLGDIGGPITLSFSRGVPFVSAFFTYSAPLILDAYGANGQLLKQVTSAYSCNYTGCGSGHPNEFIRLMSSDKITKVTIFGSATGSSFVMDDLRFGRGTTPEPSSILLFLTGLAGIARLKRKREAASKELGM